MTRKDVFRAGMLVVMSGMFANAQAQELRPVLYGTVGFSNVYRAEDRNFGTAVDAGGGVGIEWKRLGIDGDFFRGGERGLEAVSCAVSVPCSGTATSGVVSLTMASASVSYALSSSRVRPYLVGSIGAIWSTMVDGRIDVAGGAATLTEFESRDTGLTIGIGFGVDIPLTDALSIRPEFRTYTGSALSSANLGVHRGRLGSDTDGVMHRVKSGDLVSRVRWDRVRGFVDLGRFRPIP